MSENNITPGAFVYKPLRMYQRAGQRIMQAVDPGTGTSYPIRPQTFERERNRLAEKYGMCLVVIDTKYSDHERPYSAQCMGAFASYAWACDCPCGGTNHGGKDWLVNHRLISKQRLPLPFTDGRTRWMMRYFYEYKPSPALSESVAA